MRTWIIRIGALVVVDAYNWELGLTLILINYFVAYVLMRRRFFVGIKWTETVEMDLGRLLAWK